MYGTITRKGNPVATVYDHEKDLQLSVQLIRWMLEVVGAWPKPTTISLLKRYAYALWYAICISLISFLIVPSIISMIVEMERTYAMVKLAGALSFMILAIAKYVSLIFHEKDIRSGIEHIRSDWMNTRYYGDRIIMIKSAKFGRHLVTLCAGFMYGGAAFFYLAVPYSIGKVTEDDGNLTYWPMRYPVATMIIDVRYSPTNEIFFWVQCLSGFLAHSITATGCSIAAVFAMHVYGRMEILTQWIEHLIDGREDLCDDMNERLAMIVQQHVQILHFISLTDKVLREISIIEVIQCTVTICLVGHAAIVEWESKNPTSYITYIVLTLSFTFNIFILCYVGELVTEKYKKIGEVSYTIDWYRYQE
ncbi:PREDICTED: odorant receptor 4-like, partial [Wasmannia auropunctata]|uniref:odorant receptor 4-like n=1 Tax=Wasmannia auropunctata TaxID=64793 RepID=UPI0005F002A2